MADDHDSSVAPGAAGAPSRSGEASPATTPGGTRRRVLAIGAVAASSVVTIRPALAATAGSVLNCKIPIPDPGHAGQAIDAEGRLVPAGTPGAAPPAPRPVTGEEAKRMIDGLSPPGFDPSARQNYVNYIRRLQHGTSGFTCFASLQMPRP